MGDFAHIRNFQNYQAGQIPKNGKVFMKAHEMLKFFKESYLTLKNLITPTTSPPSNPPKN
jgi:hypothetical protein